MLTIVKYVKKVVFRTSAEAFETVGDLAMPLQIILFSHFCI
jgi:hypothetical protein